MDNALIIYHSFTGNTEEVAELIAKTLEDSNVNVELYRLGSGTVPEPSTFDICFLGTFTWEEGLLPEEMEDFLEFANLPENKAVFGTGDTQFGGDSMFCKAVNTIVSKYGAKYIPLKIEQSPRGTQEKKVTKWTEQIIRINKGDI
ncbi:flavodoxin [Lederbergia citrisecunda]|uniref:flavodoxin n=1 Tax=Lederbergia citrisecunda TaxID=2833583 RepID=UPI003D2C0BEA